MATPNVSLTKNKYPEALSGHLEYEDGHYAERVKYFNWTYEEIEVSSRNGYSAVVPSKIRESTELSRKNSGHFIIVIDYVFDYQSARRTLDTIPAKHFSDICLASQFERSLHDAFHLHQGTGNVKFSVSYRFTHNDFLDGNFVLYFSELDIVLSYRSRTKSPTHPNQTMNLIDQWQERAKFTANESKQDYISVRYVDSNRVGKNAYFKFGGSVSVLQAEDNGMTDGVYITRATYRLGIETVPETDFIPASKMTEAGFYDSREKAEVNEGDKLQTQLQIELLKKESTALKAEGELNSLRSQINLKRLQDDDNSIEYRRGRRKQDVNRQREELKQSREDKVQAMKFITDFMKLFPGVTGVFGKLLEMVFPVPSKK